MIRKVVVMLDPDKHPTRTVRLNVSGVWIDANLRRSGLLTFRFGSGDFVPATLLPLCIPFQSVEVSWRGQLLDGARLVLYVSDCCLGERAVTKPYVVQHYSYEEWDTFTLYDESSTVFYVRRVYGTVSRLEWCGLDPRIYLYAVYEDGTEILYDLSGSLGRPIDITLDSCVLEIGCWHICAHVNLVFEVNDDAEINFLTPI